MIPQRHLFVKGKVKFFNKKGRLRGGFGGTVPRSRVCRLLPADDYNISAIGIEGDRLREGIDKLSIYGYTSIYLRMYYITVSFGLQYVFCFNLQIVNNSAYIFR